MYLRFISTGVGIHTREVYCLQGSRYKVHNTLDESDTKNYRAEVAEIWEAGETFDPKTERLFRYLQVKIIMHYLRLWKCHEALHARPVRTCSLEAYDVATCLLNSLPAFHNEE